MGKVTLLSSECNEINSVPHIVHELGNQGYTHLELDGELYNHNLNHESIHGIVSRTVNLHEDYSRAEYHIFDIVNSDAQVSRLYKLASSSLEELTTIKVVPYEIVPCTVEAVFSSFRIYVDQGYEGIVVRHPASYYVRKRSIMIMKFKPKKMDYYKIVGSIEEISITGNPKNALGALIVESEGQQFNVGTGFTRDQREDLWRKREELPGLYVEVAYQHLTSTRRVPRFPVYLSILSQPLGQPAINTTG
jgi:ATP-dependent DNA ligase